MSSPLRIAEFADRVGTSAAPGDDGLADERRADRPSPLAQVVPSLDPSCGGVGDR